LASKLDGKTFDRREQSRTHLVGEARQRGGYMLRGSVRTLKKDVDTQGKREKKTGAEEKTITVSSTPFVGREGALKKGCKRSKVPEKTHVST